MNALCKTKSHGKATKEDDNEHERSWIVYDDYFALKTCPFGVAIQNKTHRIETKDYWVDLH